MTIHCEKSVYAPSSTEDGMRLIIMRRYPRGVAKERAHAWLPELSPTLPLVHWYHERRDAIVARWKTQDPPRYDTEIAQFWAAYRLRYLREMKGQCQRHLIALFASLHRNYAMTLTLLCACREHHICHRSLLAELITEAP